ncbi:MAG TPA: lipopolysaccharide biosynthesis protein [Beijerinckiaceae bacterium]|jgi:O-antigen/teichoic acid export membrane protein
MSTAAAGALGTGDALEGARRAGAAVLAIRIAAAGLAYGTQVLMARLMGEGGYGVFATAWVWIALLGHASLFGLSQSMSRFLPQYRVRGELDLARGFLAGGAVATLAGATAAAALGGVLLWLGRDAVGDGRVLPFALALATVPVFALQDYVQAVARAHNWAVLAIAPPFVLRQGLVALAMVAAVASGAPAEPAVAVGCTLLATAAAVAVQAVLVLRRLEPALIAGARAYRPVEWAAATWPMGFSDLTLILFNAVDVILLGLFVPPEAVGVYFAATRILQFAAFAQYAATAATAPRFAEAFARGDREGLRTLIRGTVRTTACASLAIGAALLIAAPWLLAVFGPGFGAAYGALAVLLAGVAVASAFGPAEDLLNMLGAERACARLSLAALLLAVVLNLWLVPAYGIMGAAAAMALATAARAAALALAAKARLGLPTHLLA